jgi:hypothetical protein
MRNFVLPASMVASAAAAFTLGFMVHSDPSAKPLSVPAQPSVSASGTAAEAPAKATADEAAVTATQAPRTTPTAAKHAKVTAEPETATQRPSAPRHAKPKGAGAEGPFVDAQDDGKYADDVVKSILPGLSVGVTIPDGVLPFPGRGDVTEYPYDPSWGDDPEHAADPGLVCDAELAERLGVPLDVCPDNPGSIDTWYPLPEATTTPEATATLDVPTTPMIAF